MELDFYVKKVNSVSLRRVYDRTECKYISWDFYNKYTKLEPPFPSLGLIVSLRTYHRFLPEEGRREKWCEVVLRETEYSLSLDTISSLESKIEEAERIFDDHFNLRSLPAGRTLWVGGTAITNKDATASFNCSAAAIDSLAILDQGFYLLLVGAGFGFSAENKYISQIRPLYANKKVIHKPYKGWIKDLEHTELYVSYEPTQIYKSSLSFNAKSHELTDEQFIQRHLSGTPRKVLIVVGDSKEGWVLALKAYMAALANPHIEVIEFEYNFIRPEGTRLKTFGGRASGYKALMKLFQAIEQIVNEGTIEKNNLVKLSSLQILDITNNIGLAVVVGGVRRCVPYDSMVQLLNSTKRICDVKVGDLVCSGGQIKKVLNVGPSGNRQILKIKHRFGLLECTPEHSVAVFNGINSYEFKEASELKIGDRLVWDSKGYDGIITTLPPLSEDLHFNSKQVKTPEKMDTNLAWLFGIIHGDGYIGQRTIEITTATAEKAVLERVNDIFYNYFGISSYLENMVEARGENTYRIRLNSKALATWFNQYIKQPKVSLSIPEFIIEGTREIRFAYLAGLFDSDGRGREDHRIEQLTTIYPKFKDEIITLLSTLGIGCSVYTGSAERRRDSGVNAQDFYTVSITGVINRNSWLLGVKPYCITEKIDKCNPAEDDRCTCIDFTYDAAMVGGYKKEGGVKASSLFNEQQTYYPTHITEITEGPIVSTWDMEVEDIRQFTTNGIVVHNSSEWCGADKDDTLILNAKKNLWSDDSLASKRESRSMSNNSLVLYTNPGLDWFQQAMSTVKTSGEPAFVNLARANKNDPTGTRKVFNPCVEITLNSLGVCNLTEVYLNKHLTLHPISGRVVINWESLVNSLEIATRIGTRITLIEMFHKDWDKVQKDDRLEGVSLSGQIEFFEALGYDSKEEEEFYKTVREIVHHISNKYHDDLGIPRALLTTTVKPSGTLSTIVGCGSGLHRVYAPYYIRRVRVSASDPIANALIEMNVPCSPENGQETRPDPDTWVFSFAVKGETNIKSIDEPAIVQLERYKRCLEHYVDHNVSFTCSVAEDEWDMVAQWLYDNFDDWIGISFMPKFDSTNSPYPQLPYEACDAAKYNELNQKLPLLTENQLIELIAKYEKTDELYDLVDADCAKGTCPVR